MNTTTFMKMAMLLNKLAATNSRKIKIQSLSSFLKELDSNEISPAIMLMSGSIFPQGDQRVLEIKGRTLYRVLTNTKQMTFKESPLTIIGLYEQFKKIASSSGKGSRVKKEAIITALISQADKVEADFIVRILLGELRIGLAEGLILEAISEAAGVDEQLTRRAYSLISNIGEIARIALIEGKERLDRIGLGLFEPIKPMLADTAPNLDTVLKTHNGKTILEYKLDGARVQIHKQGKHLEIYSRRLANITPSLPDITKLVLDTIEANEVILEGEVIAVNHTGKPLPFQELMRRVRRVSEVEEMTKRVPVRLYLFDILYFEGRVMLDVIQIERRRILERICPQELITPMLEADSIQKAEDFFNKAIQEGHEGLIAKSPSSRYIPGRRGKEWLKIKSAETLDTIIIAAEWGSGRRRRWLSNYHLAVRENRTNEFLDIGKTFKGLTDKEFEYLTKRLQQLKISDDRYIVHVRPKVVVEVTFDEVQRSSRYRSGYALRFARITRIREDKSTNDIDTLEKVKEIYESKFKRKAKPQLPSDK